MPIMDGFTATRKIREQKTADELPIIAMTANAMTEDRQECLSAGMNDYLAKPINVQKLLEKLMYWSKGVRQDSGEIVESVALPLDEMTVLQALTDVDTNSALLRFGGRLELYLGLLQRFRDHQRHAVARMRAALQNGERESVTRMAHTLKGLARTIGDSALADMAAEVEASSKDPRQDGDGVEALLAKLALPLLQLCEKIDRVVPPLQPQDATSEIRTLSPAETAALIPLCNEIERLLGEDDSDAGRQLEELAPILHGTIHQPLYQTMLDIVAKYDYVRTLEQLNVLRENLGIHG